MILDESLFEEIWALSQDAWEALRHDASRMPDWNEQLAKDAFIAGMVSAIAVMGHKLLDEGYRQELKG